MAVDAEEREREEPRATAKLTTEIVVAYVTKNTIAPADLGGLIGAVGLALGILGRGSTGPAAARQEPAVPVRQSVRDDHLVCLVCGKRQKMLRRHLGVAHQLTPQAYREQFGLKPNYPMTAPGYSRHRSEMAKRVGLGQRVQATSRHRQPSSGA
jgi:predicted transcriptional regulator